jgi:ABC-type transporter Mla maintaining outer membrane lipid asymmetry permease subunit MlaE
LAKTTVCAAGIAIIAYARGARPKDSSRAVSRGVTSTILWSTLYVLAVHFVFAFVEFG